MPNIRRLHMANLTRLKLKNPCNAIIAAAVIVPTRSESVRAFCPCSHNFPGMARAVGLITQCSRV